MHHLFESVQVLKPQAQFLSQRRYRCSPAQTPVSPRVPGRMKRIFGTKAPKEPGPSIDDVSTRMGTRAETIDKKIDDLDRKLVKYKQQIAAAKTSGAKNAAKQQALRLLKQKKMYEQQRDSMFSQQMNLQNAQFMTQQLQDTADQVKVMKDAHKQIQKQMKNFNVDDVEKLQDQMQDLAWDQEEIQEIMGRSFATQDYVDDDELLGELDLIEDELALEVSAPESAVPGFLEDAELPSAPTTEQQAEAPLPERPMHAPAQHVLWNVNVLRVTE
eukprot:TRINITY_DN16569_c0_g1_i1.p1 TRINITY_DN16569_c0_g1~~TRINITY_DN16569_c0_g1_i1.p1  ORF type:complete len:272 (-),score=37.68 TRINITY_DN16569_c0_g1_i1:216-1031(-)